MIKPAQVCELTASERAEFALHETKIDKMLRDSHGSGVYEATRASQFICARLAEAYTQNGWTVKLHHGDQRDPGPFLTFSRGCQ